MSVSGSSSGREQSGWGRHGVGCVAKISGADSTTYTLLRQVRNFGKSEIVITRKQLSYDNTAFHAQCHYSIGPLMLGGVALHDVYLFFKRIHG